MYISEFILLINFIIGKLVLLCILNLYFQKEIKKLLSRLDKDIDESFQVLSDFNQPDYDRLRNSI